MACKDCEQETATTIEARLDRIEDQLRSISQFLGCIILGAAIAVIVFGPRDPKDKGLA
jgi:hypothetical protein